MRWVLLAAAVLIIGIVLTASFLEPPQEVQAAVAERGTLRAFVEERARTRVPRVYRITMPADGRIEEIALQEGDPVSAGQVVARMTPRDLELAVAAGRAAVAALEAQIVEQEDDRLELSLLEGVNKELEAIENLVAAARARTEATQAYVEFADWSLQQIQGFFETGSAAERELRDARLQEVEANIDHTTAVLLARAISAIQAAAQIAPTMIRQYIDKKDLSKAVLAQQLAEAQADLARLELQQERGVLRSPVDGVVLTRAVVNERVLGAGTLLLEIGRLEELQVEVDVLTQDAAQIEPGQPADILGAAIGPEPAEGLVRRVHPEGFTKISSLGVEQQRVTVVVDFAPGELSRLAEAGYRLGSAYRVRVRIYTDEQADAVIIPRAALFRSAGGIWQAVTVVDGVADVRNLQIGLMNPEAVAVMAGVEANEQVVLAPDAGLTSGTTLQPVLTNATGK